MFGSNSQRWLLAGALGLLGTGVGCAGRPAIFPNSDPALRHTSAEFAADAAIRHPYKAEAPRGGTLNARAEIEYGLAEVRLLNMGDEDWNNAEVWVNQKYCVFVPKIAPKKLETVKFQMMYDDKGHFYPPSITADTIKKVEVLLDGKMYEVKVALAE